MKNSKAAIGFIFITLLIDVMGFGIIIPVMPALITKLGHTNVSEAAKIGGWMMFAFAAFQFLFSPLLGNLSDRYGRRPILLISLLGFGIDYLFMAMAPTLTWLFVGRCIAGITGASFTTATAYIADVSPPEKKAQNFGLIGAAFGLGFILGPVLGGLLGKFGPTVPFFAAAGLTLLNWLYGFFILPESLEKHLRRPFEWKRANPLGSLKMLKNYPKVLGLIVALSFLFVASHAVQSNWSYFTIKRFGWSEDMVGYSLGLAGLLVGLVQAGLTRIVVPKLGEKKSVFLGFSLYIVGFLLFSFASQSWMMFAFLIPYCMGGFAGPALQSIMSNNVPPNEQGELQGANTSIMSLTSIIGPPLMTNLFAYFTAPQAPIYFPGAAFFMAALLTIVGTIWAYKELKKH